MKITIRRATIPGMGASARSAATLAVLAAFSVMAAAAETKPPLSSPIARASRRRRPFRRPAGSKSSRAPARPRRRRRPPRQRPAHAQARLQHDWGIRIGTDAWVQRLDESGERRPAAATPRSSSSAASRSTTTGLRPRRRASSCRRSRSGIGFGSGKPDYGAQRDLQRRLRRLAHRPQRGGDPTRRGDAGRVAHAVARRRLAVAPLDDRWGVVGEVSGTAQHGAEASRQLLLAASYSVSKRLVLDAGAARTLRSGAPTWSAFTGLTWLAARVF